MHPHEICADTGRVRIVSVLVALLLGLTPGFATVATASAPSDAHVAVSDFLFDPTTTTIARGGTVTFDFIGPSHHTVTDASGMGWYDSGSVGAGDPSFALVLPAAGVYRFTCIPHPWMGGRIEVPMRAQPRRGSPQQVFTVTWASAPPDAGYVYDVEIRRPDDRWTTWRTGRTTLGTTFRVHAGRGDFRFRARMRSLSGGQAGWSTPVTINVG